MNPFNTSGKPLMKKLGIKKNMMVTFIQPPDYLFDLLGDFPEGVQFINKANKTYLDYIHGFYARGKDLQRDLPYFKEYLRKEGMIWISWPKGKSGMDDSLNREKIRECFLKEGFVDIKVCAIDDTWSALKFVFRKKNRI